MATEIDRVSAPEDHRTNQNGTEITLADIETLVGLIRKGAPASLAESRKNLGVTLSALSSLVGVSESTLNAWEIGTEQPPQSHLITWRLRVGDLVEKKIAAYIGTTNPELIMSFWEIIWRLHDL